MNYSHLNIFLRKFRAIHSLSIGAFLFEPVSQEGKERKISSNESLTKRHGKANLGMQGFERNLQMEALLFTVVCNRKERLIYIQQALL